MDPAVLLPDKPEKLRPLLHAEIDRLADDDLAVAHRALLEIEMRRQADQLGEALAEGRAAGRVTDERISESIREHRRKHPYGG